MFQYPAMMVSPMQGALIDVLREHRDGPITMLDPFVGSGTTMIEAMRRGLAFRGSDLNPLAVLIARVETAEAAELDMAGSLAHVCSCLQNIRGAVEVPDDPFTERWFRADVARELAALREAIRAESDVTLRRLWWACVAEICRISSNARISTPKLQTRRLGELARAIDIEGRFVEQAQRAMTSLTLRRDQMVASGLVKHGAYLPGVDVALADARALPDIHAADVVLTSPPYGDNHTTMPYGQASALPLRWIDIADAVDDIPEYLVASTRSLDTASLGGSRGKSDADRVAEVCARSTTLLSVMTALFDRSLEAWNRVGAFFIDYDEAWESIVQACRPDAHLILTLGDRTVRGVHVPTAAITKELLAARGVREIASLQRQIPRNKRIANRNVSASTIGYETVLVLQRDG